MTRPGPLPPPQQGSIAPLLGAIGFVIALCAAWFLIRPADPTGLPLPPWVPPTVPGATTGAPSEAAPVAAPAVAPPTDAAPDQDPSAATVSDLVASRMELDRKKMIALAKLGPDFTDAVDALYADARAKLDAMPARVASGELSPEQANDAQDQIRRAFGDAMVAALPPEVLERISQGDGGREQP